MVNVRCEIKLCEADIREGKIQSAILRLSQINMNSIPNELRCDVANLCRRTGLVAMGLKILTPKYAGNRSEWLTRASANEVAEYALLLQRTGSVNEALEILVGINVAIFPDALLYRAFCHFNRWEYLDAIPLLYQYLSQTKDDYKILVGRVNLAAALVATDSEEAMPMLADLLKFCCEQGSFRLAANCHELIAQQALAEFDLVRATMHIKKSFEILRSSETLDQLFLLKLQAVTRAIETDEASPLDEFRQEARRRLDWESVRDVDFLHLKLWFDQDKFNRLIFGTPFHPYRQRVCQVLNRRPDSDSYVFGHTGAQLMDLARAQINGVACFQVGSKVHQMLEILMRDFYRPKSLTVLFAELFPNDHFDIYSSTDRVHQILRRTRAWLSHRGVPVEIAEFERYYSLRIVGSFGIEVNLERVPTDWNQVQLRRLHSIARNDRIYGPKELRDKLGLGATPFRRFVVWALEEGRLARSGSGSATSYRLLDNKAAS